MRWMLGCAALVIGLGALSGCAQSVAGGGDGDGSSDDESGSGGEGGSATSGAGASGSSGPGATSGSGATDSSGGAGNQGSTGPSSSSAQSSSSSSQAASSSSSGGGPVPSTWICSATYYGAGDGCDCSCGAHDPDCDDPTQSLFCNQGTFGAEPGQQCVNDVCTPPTAWTCTADLWAQEAKGSAGPACDCGCGYYDPDCENLSLPLGGCQAGEQCNDDAVCIPAAWTCNPDWYGDAGCDCGCGVVDIDCADATVTSCEYCGLTGSCASGSCPANINPSNNATCI